MCGILGFFIPKHLSINDVILSRLLTRLFQLSESRGKEASGLALADDKKTIILREPISAGKMVKLTSYQKTVKSFLSNAGATSSLTAIGHARLATNGWQDKSKNNQPVARDGVILVHNGIIVNDDALWKKLKLAPETELDSEVIAAYIAQKAQPCSDYISGINDFFANIKGNASIACLTAQACALYLATNNASIYYVQSAQGLIFASERYILEQIIEDPAISAGFSEMSTPERVPNNQPLMCFSDQGNLKCVFSEQGSDLKEAASTALLIPRFRAVEDLSRRDEEARANLRRCTRCILPETMPFITYDDEGVCNYCHNYERMQTKGREQAREDIAQYRRNDGKPDSLLMLSGGRDSCFGLHYVVKELGLTPIAYTYDWGMVTDLARRNSSRMCGALGVEQIIVSADIRWKRRNVRKNLLAWLKKPELGMVPLLMAGDKQYFYYAEQIRKTNQLPITIVSENPMEASRFKSGFCGVNEANHRIYNIPATKKLKLLSYYGLQYLRNPRYINGSLLDNTFAFFSSYVMKHNLFHIFRYEKWNENTVNETLQNQYGWEIDEESRSTWRIGDGTAAFYNYIYFTLAGLTENDTLRSNQIREGMLNRKAALEAVKLENQPRWKSMEWYAQTIGFNLVEAVLRINQAPKLYI